MAADDQPALFDPAVDARMNRGPGARHPAARAEFLAGMLGAWALDGRTPSKAQRSALLTFAGRVLSDAEAVAAAAAAGRIHS